MRYFQRAAMICRMCLMDSPEAVDIFAGEKTAYNIAATIAQHFWFEPKYDDQMSNMVCGACWRQIESFHEYYLSVEEAQRKLSAELAVKPKLQEQQSLEKFVDAGIHAFVKIEPEVCNVGNYANLGGDGCAIEAIEYGVEQKLEQDYASDYKANLYHYFTEELAVENTKSGEHHEGLIEEVKASLYDDDILEKTVIIHPEEQSSAEELIKKESLDSNSKGHIVYADDYDSDNAPLSSLRIRQTEVCSTDLANYDSDDAPLASLRLRNTEICSADQTKIQRKESRQSLLKCKEVGLGIARHIELKCDLCRLEFATFAEIARHMIKCHGRRGYVKCCKRKFFGKRAVLDHMHSHFEFDNFKCSKCNKSYTDKRSLNKHLSRHDVKEQDYRKYSCGNCSKRFYRQYSRNQHNCLISKKPCFSCGICFKSFKLESQLETHQSSVHEPKKCGICAKVIKGETLFAEHQLEHGDFVDPKVQCEKCGIWLKNRLRLKFHTKNAHLDGKSVKRREFTCKICGKMSISNVGLKAHMKNMHATQRKFVCSVCGKGFKRVRNLKDHMARHTGELLYTCPQCPRTFRNSGSMYGHRRTAHRKEWEESRRIREQEKMKNEHICNICGKTSISKDGLKSHMKSVHKAQRKFACSLCGKGFKRRLYLKEHMACHTGEYLYTCTYCPKSFRNSGSMYGHRKRAHRQEWEERRKMLALPANQKSKVIQNIASKETKINPNLS